jgi:hypothetical protein
MKYTAIPLLLAIAASASAQNIERVKMSDNDLSCQQIFAEIGQMDGLIARSNQPVAAPAVAAADPGAAGQGGVVAGQMVGAVAQTAAARGGFGGFGSFGGLGGALGGMIGNLASQAGQQQAQQQAAQQAAAQQQLQQNAVLGQQAQGRKEHLTGMFLTKGCKMSDVQK